MHTLLHSVPLTLWQATAKPRVFWRLLDAHGKVLGQSLVRPLLLSPGSWCTQGSVCALQESVSTVLCKFWWLYGGVNGNLLQEGLCHTQVCCAQSPCPCSRPLLTHASTGNSWTHTGKSGSVSCGVTLLSSGSWCTQGSVCALQESVSPVFCKFWWLYGGSVVTSSKRAYATHRSTAPRAPVSAAVHC